MSKRKLIYNILNDIENNKSNPTEKDYELNINDFADIIDIMEEERLVKGSKVIRGGMNNDAQMVLLTRMKITLDGLKYLEENKNYGKTYKELAQVKKGSESMDKDYERTCFIVSPISGENTDIRRRADSLIKNIIAPVLEERGMECVRIDFVNETGKISDKIMEYLKKSCLVISDVTGNNPNVFYEVGYRHGINKPQILLAETYDGVPFDIKDENIIKYDFHVDKIQKVKEILGKTIENTLSEYSKKKEEVEVY